MTYPSAYQILGSNGWAGVIEYRLDTSQNVNPTTVSSSTPYRRFYEHAAVGGAFMSPNRGFELYYTGTNTYCVMTSSNNSNFPKTVAVTPVGGSQGSFGATREVFQNCTITFDNPGDALVNNLQVGDPTVTLTPTVTSSTNTNTGGRQTLSAEFTIINPVMVKTGIDNIRITYGDHYVINPYVVRISYTGDNGADYVEHTYGVGSKNVQLDIDFSSVGIHTGNVYLSFDRSVKYNNVNYTQNAYVKTFNYYEIGPFTASFSPDFGLPGQSISYSIVDTNPYPNTASTMRIDHPSFTNVANGTLPSINTNAFTSVHGTYTITINGNVITTATYDTNYVVPTTTSNGGGRPDRYPLIMTNLFNRNRSLYSIGMTHKDTWDLFL